MVVWRPLHPRRWVEKRMGSFQKREGEVETFFPFFWGNCLVASPLPPLPPSLFAVMVIARESARKKAEGRCRGEEEEGIYELSGARQGRWGGRGTTYVHVS